MASALAKHQILIPTDQYFQTTSSERTQVYKDNVQAWCLRACWLPPIPAVSSRKTASNFLSFNGTLL